MRNQILTTLGVLVFAGIASVASADWDAKHLDELNRRCLALPPGVSMEDLTQMFGKPRTVERFPGLYIFGPSEYGLRYSDDIRAQVNDQGKVVSLSCGEGMRVFELE